eukprot:5678016-Alexandrium_andersonii.AAC.1
MVLAHASTSGPKFQPGFSEANECRASSTAFCVIAPGSARSPLNMPTCFPRTSTAMRPSSVSRYKTSPGCARCGRRHSKMLATSWQVFALEGRRFQPSSADMAIVHLMSV